MSSTNTVLRSLVRALRRDVRGANFVEYMVLVALAVGAVLAGAKTLGGAVQEKANSEKGEISGIAVK
ncbi:MAG: hypothetical protein JWP97_162 [Labilithrix sp.]|nr:hypothetical protein [Labilithrix sp.]